MQNKHPFAVKCFADLRDIIHPFEFPLSVLGDAEDGVVENHDFQLFLILNRATTNRTLTKVVIYCMYLSKEDIAMFRILVVEDDRELNRQVCSYLSQSGYEANGCLSANDAFNTLYNDLYDLIISDIMMPGMDGFEFARTVRENSKDIPILFMTARDDFAAKRQGFQIGIDDYLVKPVDLEELVLRVGALLRRAKIAGSHRLEVGDVALDSDERSCTVNGEEISLTTREFNILFKLLSYPKKTFTRAQLMDEFWDAESSSTLRTVDVYMTKLREKFAGTDAFEIQTVRGLGYKAVLK